jgi:uroporphyrinogen-III synthase
MPPAAVLFASGSSVRGLLALTGDTRRDALLAIPALVVGPATAAVAREAGFAVVAEASDPGAHALARLTGERLSTASGDHR